MRGDGDDIRRGIDEYLGHDESIVKLTRADAVVCRPVDWLWRDWLARGKLHILAGAPGAGKTTIALAMAAAVSCGGKWPDGTAAPAGDILIWSGEDDPSDTLVPRLRAAGADLSRVHFVGDVLSGGEPRAFDPARDIGALTRAAAELGEIVLMIVDPVVSAVAADSHKNTEVRRALQPVVNLAANMHCTMIGISHFSKGSAGRDPTERVTGSVAFGALARIVMVAAKGEDGGRLLARSKSNIGPDGGGFTYTMEQAEFDGLSASLISWGDDLEGTARELLGDTEAGDTPRDDAAAWLERMLWSEPVAVKALKAEANAAGLSWRTVERAKTEVGAVAERVQDGSSRGQGHWQWRLVDKADPSKTASLTVIYGGVKETQQTSGFEGDSETNTANPHGDGVELCRECLGKGCPRCRS